MRFVFISAVSLLALLLAAVTGCDSDKKASDPITRSMFLAEFPHAVGNWWRYEVVERDLSIGGETWYDTVLVTVVDSSDILCDPNPCPESFSQRWELRSGSSTDSMTVMFWDDWLIFEDHLVPHTLDFPLTLDKTWVGVTALDSTTVTDMEMMTLGSGDRIQCYVVNGSYYDLGFIKIHSVKVSPEVGLAQVRVVSGLGVVPEGIEREWTLLEWQVQ